MTHSETASALRPPAEAVEALLVRPSGVLVAAGLDSRDARRMPQGARGFPSSAIAAPTDFVGNIFRCIARPALTYIETDDAHRVRILAVEQIADDGLKIGRLDIGLAPCKAVPA